MNVVQSSYDPPRALTIISSISIGIAALCSFWILFDILYRKGWRTMMGIMIPVYIINALYLWPITLWTYINYGRPPKHSPDADVPSSCAHHPPHANTGGETNHAHSTEGGDSGQPSDLTWERATDQENWQGRAYHQKLGSDHIGHDNMTEQLQTDEGHSHHDGSERPMFATITVAVCHCGAGCVLGDIVGEWLVYGTRATINERTLWPEFLIDFGFAIAFGIIFQYFSIAPMAGEYGPKTIYRAAKADILSLIFFEIGLFGWMAVFQIAIFQWKLEMNTATYWWMMQVGMFLGHWTGVPINWWLIRAKIKEPCA